MTLLHEWSSLLTFCNDWADAALLGSDQHNLSVYSCPSDNVTPFSMLECCFGIKKQRINECERSISVRQDKLSQYSTSCDGLSTLDTHRHKRTRTTNTEHEWKTKNKKKPRRSVWGVVRSPERGNNLWTICSCSGSAETTTRVALEIVPAQPTAHRFEKPSELLEISGNPVKNRVNRNELHRHH